MAMACGNVESKPTDAPPQQQDGPVTPMDGLPADGLPPDGNLTCTIVQITVCDTNDLISHFCPTGQTVRNMVRCDGSMVITGDQYNNMFHLCGCNAPTCGCDSVGVVYQAVECCM